MIDICKRIIKRGSSFIISEKLMYVVGIVICLCNSVFLFDNAIWGDEAFSFVLVRNGLRDILAGTAADVHPPLYYLALKFFLTIFGESVFIGHLTSYLSFLAACILIMTFIYKNFGLISAYLGLFFVGWTQYGMVYSGEIRMYSMALLFITLTFCMGYKVICRNEFKDWILMSVYALLAGYTHYFALITVAFIILGVWGIAVIKWQKNVFKNILITSGLCIAGYLPWLVAMLTTVKRTMGGFWLTGIPTFKECMQMFFGLMNYSEVLVKILLILLGVYIFSNIIKVSREKLPLKEKVICFLEYDSKVNMALLGLWSFAGTSILGIIVSKAIQPVLLIRYLFPMVVLGAISLGVLLHHFIQKEKIGKIVSCIACVMLICVAYSGATVYAERLPKHMERKNGTDVSLAKMDEYVECGYMIITNIHNIGWNVLEYYYPDNYVEKTDDHDKVIMLWDSELNENEINKLMKDKVKIVSEDKGQIDSEVFYMYCIERGSGQ